MTRVLVGTLPIFDPKDLGKSHIFNPSTESWDRPRRHNMLPHHCFYWDDDKVMWIARGDREKECE